MSSFDTSTLKILVAALFLVPWLEPYFSFVSATNNPHDIILPANKTNFSLSVRTARKSVVSGGLFSVVSFNNVACVGSSGKIGTCYSAQECNTMKGVADGPCAGNFGVVCVFSVTCGGTVTRNNTYFINPSAPNSDTGPLACQITIQKFGTATEYIVDYTSAAFASSTNGECSTDFVTSNDPSFDTACGTLTGNSAYVPWGTASVGTLKVHLGSSTSWQILISQTKAGDCCYAPPGCDQYYNTNSGVLTSPGYDGTSPYITSGSCVRQCFQLPSGFCSVTLSPGSFSLQGTAGNCTSDYVQAEGDATQYCGDVSAPIKATGTAGKYTFFDFCTGSGNTGEPGYSMNYNVNVC